MRSQGRSECSGRWCAAEGQPLLATAVTVALLSLATAAATAAAAAAAANLILRTHRLTEKGGTKGREGEEKRMLLSGAERKRVTRGWEARAALTTSREAARNVALSREGWVTPCRSIPLCLWSGSVLMISTHVSRSITCDLHLTLDFGAIGL